MSTATNLKIFRILTLAALGCKTPQYHITIRTTPSTIEILLYIMNAKCSRSYHRDSAWGHKLSIFSTCYLFGDAVGPGLDTLIDPTFAGYHRRGFASSVRRLLSAYTCRLALLEMFKRLLWWHVSMRICISRAVGLAPSLKLDLGICRTDR